MDNEQIPEQIETQPEIQPETQPETPPEIQPETQPETPPQIFQIPNLFTAQLPDIKKIKEIAAQINSGEFMKLKFIEEIEKNNSNSLPAGIGYCIVAKYSQAAELLDKAPDCPEKFLFLAKALKGLKQFDKAIEAIDKCKSNDQLMVNLEKAAILTMAKDYQQAEKQLENCKNYEKVSADYHCRLAMVQEGQGQYSEAIENYKTAIEIDPNHAQSLFRLAYRSDLVGDMNDAIDYYKQLIKIKPVYISALLNLAIIYEDMENYDRALIYIEKILIHHPNHRKALMYKKDIESSETMLYDEEKEKRKDRRNQILETPISDFELSVRSRNCLKKMNINTIGDLLNITEAELLSYKNFGETSLKEIKAILNSKTLQLGMSTEGIKTDVMDGPQSEVEDSGMLSKPVDDLNLSVRSRKCLQKLTLGSIGELTRKTEAELLGCKNFGVTSLYEIKKALTDLGFSLRSLD